MTATSTTAAAMPAAADLCAQALKALAERCPFDTEEAASRPTTLPFGVAARYSDGRRKFKKSSSSHAEQAVDAAPKVSKQPKVPNLWDLMEVYFRPITEADIESLRPRGLLDSLDSCFSIPLLDCSLELEKKYAIFSGSEVGVSSEVVKEEEEEEKKKPMEIDSVGDLSTAETSTLPIPEVKEEDANEDESSSRNWVLGSKHRAILTTLRPTKKRKLLGSDAGLDQLLVLPHSEQGSARCHVCCLGESGGKSNKIISCSSCGAIVHKKCYGIHEAVDEKWVCSWCKHLEEMWDGKRGNEGLRPCILCPKEGGALKPVGGDLNNEGENKFAHLFCSLWTPHVHVVDTKSMEPVVNIVDVTEMKTKMVCNVCKVKHGVCVRCSSGKFLLTALLLPYH